MSARGDYLKACCLCGAAPTSAARQQDSGATDSLDYWGQVQSMRRGVITTKPAAAAAHCTSKRGDSGVTADDRPSSHQQRGTQMFLSKVCRATRYWKTTTQTYMLTCAGVSLEIFRKLFQSPPVWVSNLVFFAVSMYFCWLLLSDLLL